MSVWKQAFEVVQRALSVVNKFGNLPLVNLIPYVSTITAAAGAVEAGINAGVRVAPYIEAIADTFKDGLPSDEQHRALDERIAELEARVQAPLPPREDGEPE